VSGVSPTCVPRTHSLSSVERPYPASFSVVASSTHEAVGGGVGVPYSRRVYGVMYVCHVCMYDVFVCLCVRVCACVCV